MGLVQVFLPALVMVGPKSLDDDLGKIRNATLTVRCERFVSDGGGDDCGTAQGAQHGEIQRKALGPFVPGTL